MDTYYFDWAHGKVTVLKNNERNPKNYYSLDQLLDTLTEPSRIIGEATFESFFRDSKRNDIIRRAETEGHVLLTTPNRATPRWRGKNEKTDENDVKAIRRMAERVHLKKPRLFDPDDPFIELRQMANKELMILRYTKLRIPRKDGKGFLAALGNAKDQWARDLIDKLPVFETLTDIQKEMLGNYDARKERYVSYNPVIVAAVGMATKYADNVKTFDRLSGLFHHGYPSQIRSDLFFHGWKKRIWYPYYEQGVEETELRGMLKDYRREIRWLYHQLKTIV